MKNYSKLSKFYFLAIMVLFLACSQDENLTDMIPSEVAYEGKQGYINFETLVENIGSSTAFKTNIVHFDKNKSAPVSGRGIELVDAYIDTNTISLIETDNINYYTLKIINNNPEEKANTFYNLVFEQNLATGEVTSSILQYNPELEWLFDKSQDFEGNIKKFDNAEITLDDLINGTHLEDRSVIPSCVFSISSYWYCPNGHSSPDDLGGNCGGEWVIDLNTGPCPPNTGGGGGGSSGGGNGDGGTGGGGSSGSTHTVILEICDGFSLPGEGGNSEDCEDDYAAYFIPYICNSYQNITFINNWALNNQEDAVELASYLANNFTEYDTNNCADFDFETLITLTDQLENNPYLLLDIDCTQIANWQTLAQHTAPYGVQIKIDNLPSNIFNDFYIQSLEDAGGTIVNMDYFSVKVTSLPTNPDTGQQFTADGLLDYFRRDINSFIDDTSFEPYCEIQSLCQQETDLWNSNNPLGSLIYIDIPFDDGTVICTEFESDYWYFMTMNAPHSGNHPVAGTRQFGYEQNNDGSYNFFVRGVDRFDSNLMENVAYI